MIIFWLCNIQEFSRITQEVSMWTDLEMTNIIQASNRLARALKGRGYREVGYRLNLAYNPAVCILTADGTDRTHITLYPGMDLGLVACL